MILQETAYKFGFIIIYVILTVIRVIFKIRIRVYKQGFFSREEGKITIAGRFFLGIPMLAGFSAYIIDHTISGWMYIHLPDALRVTGIGTSLAALLLLLQSHRALGSYFSTTLRLTENHHLITTGPYRYIQHPIYLAYCILFLSAFLLTCNWVIGITGLGIILMLMTLRRRKEEALLLEHFGDAYSEYQKATGRFIPGIKRNGKEKVLAAIPAENISRRDSPRNCRRKNIT